MSRRRERRRRAAARSRDRMQINVVRHLVVLMIVQVKFHLVALADTNEAAGHIAAERPEHILDAIGQALRDFSDFDVHDDLGGLFSCDRRRHVRGLREHCRLDAGNFGFNKLRASGWRGGLICRGGQLPSGQCEQHGSQGRDAGVYRGSFQHVHNNYSVARSFVFNRRAKHRQSG